MTTRDSALVITQQIDPQGRTAKNGRPAWLTGFITTRGKKTFPLDCYVEVECEFDTSTPGNWWAPWWSRLVPGGADGEERDFEWFGNRPDRFRFGYHVNGDGDAPLNYNVDSRIFGRSNDVVVANPGARHRYAWWTRKDPAHPGSRLHTRYADGKQMMHLSTWEMAQKGYPSDAVLNQPGAALDFAICGQAESTAEAGMLFRPGEKGPYEMKVHWIAVSVPA